MRLSREKINHLSQLILKVLGEEGVAELKQEPNDVRLQIVRLLTEELKIDEEVDRLVRGILESYSRQIIEGSTEWDVMYQKHYNEEMAKRRLP